MRLQITWELRISTQIWHANIFCVKRTGLHGLEDWRLLLCFSLESCESVDDCKTWRHSWENSLAYLPFLLTASHWISRGGGLLVAPWLPIEKRLCHSRFLRFRHTPTCWTRLNQDLLGYTRASYILILILRDEGMTLQSLFGSGALEATLARQNVVQLVRRRFWECEDLGIFVGKHCCNVSLTKLPKVGSRSSANEVRAGARIEIGWMLKWNMEPLKLKPLVILFGNLAVKISVQLPRNCHFFRMDRDGAGSPCFRTQW